MRDVPQSQLILAIAITTLTRQTLHMTIKTAVLDTGEPLDEELSVTVPTITDSKPVEATTIAPQPTIAE